MDRKEQEVIDKLFAKLQQAEAQSGPRDEAAETRIRQHVSEQPAAPYYLSQAVVFQEEALRQAQKRIEELESELASRPSGGGFLAGLFGGNGSADRTAGGRPGASAAGPSPLAAYRDRAEPSFLGGAMQTAMGVAGGVMLGSFLASMFGGGTSEAAPPSEAPPEAPAAEEADSGFDSGWDGSFDDGGGFDF